MAELISTKGFAIWPGFRPGLEFLESSKNLSTDLRWASSVPRGIKTELVPMFVAPAEAEPNSKYWKTQVNNLEWEAVKDIWNFVGHTILYNDPWFNLFKLQANISADGSWSEAFRRSDTFRVFADGLAIRMNEEIDTTRTILESLEQKALKLHREESEPISPEQTIPSAQDNFETQIRIPWGKVPWEKVGRSIFKGATWVRRIGVFSPQGLAWDIGFRVAEYGYHEYKDWQRAKQRAEKQKKKQQAKLDAQQLAIQVQGFAVPSGNLGLLATYKSNSKMYDWRNQLSAPAVLVSQDGIYL
jgi:hypothetical protein